MESVYEQALREIVEINHYNVDLIERLAQEYVDDFLKLRKEVNESVINGDLWFLRNLSNYTKKVLNELKPTDRYGFYTGDYNDPKLEGKTSLYYKDIIDYTKVNKSKLSLLRTRATARMDFYIVYDGIVPYIGNVINYNTEYKALMINFNLFLQKVNLLLGRLNTKDYIFTFLDVRNSVNLTTSNHIKMNISIGYSK